MPVDSDTEDIAAQLENLASELRSSRGRRAAAHRKPDPETDPIEDPETGEVLRDLTTSAVWTVSSAKAGNGAEQLLDGNADTYWQSDGVQPHTITAQFSAKRRVKEVQLFLNYVTDESYTPAVVSVHAGSNFHDLRIIRHVIEFDAPQGWVRITLPADAADLAPDEPSDDDEEGDSPGEAGGGAQQAAVRRQAREERARARRHRMQVRKEERERRKARKEELALLQEDRSYVNAHMVQIMIHCNHQNGRDSHVRMVRVLGMQKQVARIEPKFSTPEFQRFENGVR